MIAARQFAALARREASRPLARALATDTSGGVKLYTPKVPERRTGEAGPGGRASVAGVKVAIFGAGGFLGRYVCCELGTNGALGYIANRGDEFEMRHLKPNFDLGRSRFTYYSPRDRDSMAEVIADADIVINMVGKYYETKAPSTKESFPYVYMKTNFTFEQCNVDIPRTIAELCTEMQVDNLIHVSSLAANPESKSEWARTKFEGEQAVKEAFPWATVIRPAQLFGPEDKFLNWFANTAWMYPAVPLVDGGHALTQPVYAPDVAKVITKVVDDPEKFEGRTVDVFGPSDYTYKELAEFVYDITGQDAAVLDMPKNVLKGIASVLQYQSLGKGPMITPDLVELMTEDYVPPMTQEEYDAQPENDKILTMKDLGIEGHAIEKIAFNYLHRFRTGGHFQITSGYQGQGHSSRMFGG
mmetsp:Transcript_29805/g.88470  ORF Transcript_29805/g.88470 Transcript_29805/m.88470 type:complete len:414 (-) Transcript_29805:91-1332(-)